MSLPPLTRSRVRRGAHTIGSCWRWQLDKRSKIRHRLGYRGLVLLMFGLIYVMIGLAVIGSHDYTPDLVHTHLPLWFRITLWCVPGAISVALCLDHKWQAIGFALLFLPPAERAVSYFIAAVSVPTWSRVPACLVYVLILLMVTFIAAWPEPSEVEKKTIEQDRGQVLASDDQKRLTEDGRLVDDSQGGEQ